MVREAPLAGDSHSTFTTGQGRASVRTRRDAASDGASLETLTDLYSVTCTRGDRRCSSHEEEEEDELETAVRGILLESSGAVPWNGQEEDEESCDGCRSLV